MRTETALLWWHLGILTKRRYDALLQEYGNVDEPLAELNGAMLTALGVRSDVLLPTLERLQLFNAEAVLADMRSRGVKLVDIEDPAYPSALRQAPDAPVCLSYIGNLSVLQSPLIGVVGTRRMSPYGRRVVEQFMPILVRHGMVTVSGLALGVDAAVARDTLNANGKTVAVLGHGLAHIYPKTNQALAQKIVDAGGLIVSEFPLHQQPEAYTFPARNRIIAGLSMATLVCEAPEDSGSMITAELALEYNRDVFAVPGQIFDDNYAGCHQLISKGHAKLVCTPEDILREIGMIVQDRGSADAFVPSSESEAAVYNVLTGMQQTIDDLIGKTGLDAARIATVLTLLELAGAAKNTGGGQWVRS